MIQLRLHTEYSYRKAYGKVDTILEMVTGAAAITDNGTWGHVSWVKACKKKGIKPILGVEIPVVSDARVREKQPGAVMAFLAKNTAGLQELYAMASLANKDLFYFNPRIDYRDVNGLSPDVIRLSGHGADLSRLQPTPETYLEYNTANPAWNRRVAGAPKIWSRVVCSANLYPRPEDRVAYEVLVGSNSHRMGPDRRTGPGHILSEDELRISIPEADDDAYLNTERIAAEINCDLPRADVVRPPETPLPLRVQCMLGIPARGIDWTDIYQARLDRELALIEEKKFEDYFHLVGDMVRRAKERMFVGPARGSSAGSLVCYLLGITDVDPLRHDLMFERFIDITRADLPDIDIDFPDNQRDDVIVQLGERYGADRVGRIGTVMRYKAKSVLGDVARELSIPKWEIEDVKDAVIERSTGDARAQFCVMDALQGLDIGKALVLKYPQISIAGEMEGHATTGGTHAAGVIVCQKPVRNYATIDRSGTAQIDKKDAETLNLLKIDVLGLRTLAVLQDCLDQIGKDKGWLITYPLDDTQAFELFNAERYSGIFQYEGYALQSLTRQMKIANFDDIVIITALARPGPLHCGAATEFIARRIGIAEVTYLHPLAEPFTRETYGSIIYQEQVMACGRAIGQLSWEDVSELRKAMSKSLGEEFFNTYWVKFEEGAAKQGIASVEARRIWDKMCTFGSWAFNKSHAVSYGLLSYWCAVLKAHYPLEYAAACLRSVKDDEQGIKILRDLVKEGFSYTPVDPARSGLDWAVVEGRLVGGLTNMKGCGPSKAKAILTARAAGKPYSPGLAKMLTNPITPYDDIFEGERRFGDMYRNPKAYKVNSGPISHIQAIGDPGEYVFIGRLKEKNLRDLNEYGNLVKRGGRKIARNSVFLNLVLEDDTGSIIAKVGRHEFAKLGKPIIEKGKIGDWFLWKGHIRADGWRMLLITQWRALSWPTPIKAPSVNATDATSDLPTKTLPRDSTTVQKIAI